jgi:hypothetical protein
MATKNAKYQNDKKYNINNERNFGHPPTHPGTQQNAQYEKLTRLNISNLDTRTKLQYQRNTMQHSPLVGIEWLQKEQRTHQVRKGGEGKVNRSRLRRDRKEGEG